MQVDKEFNKLGSKYDIPIPNNTFVNKMANYSKEDIKKEQYLSNVHDVIDFCSLTLFYWNCDYFSDLKKSWNIDITVTISDESFPPRWVEFILDHETIYDNGDNNGIGNKELFNSLPDEYQKKIIDFTNEYSQFQERTSKEYSDFITNYFS